MTQRALLAILEARLYAERRTVLYACIAAIVVGLLQPRGVAGPIAFCSFLGIVMALAQSPGRHAHLDRCEQCAPLFGRELARAKALVPCVAAIVATLAYLAAQYASGSVDALASLTVALTAVVATTLTALSATIRTGYARMLYVLLACATAVTAYAIAVAAHSLPAELFFCAAVSFVAIRQYGEALARYDPI